MHEPQTLSTSRQEARWLLSMWWPACGPFSILQILSSAARSYNVAKSSPICGSYFITTYIQRQATWKLKKRKGKKLTGLLHLCTLLLAEFLLFFTVPLSIEAVTPIRISITVHLMVTFAVDTLEWMRARLTILCYKPWRRWFIVFLVAPCHLLMVLRFMRSIAFDASGHVWLAAECWVSPFPIVFTLRNAWVHIHAMNSDNILANVKLSVDDYLRFSSTL